MCCVYMRLCLYRSFSLLALSLSLSLYLSKVFPIKYLPQYVAAHVRLPPREVVGDRVDCHHVGHQIDVVLQSVLRHFFQGREVNPG